MRHDRRREIGADADPLRQRQRRASTCLRRRPATDVRELHSVRGTRRQLPEQRLVGGQLRDDRADLPAAADELSTGRDGVLEPSAVAVAADLDQEPVAPGEPREARRVMAADRPLQPRRRGRGDRVQLALVQEPREPRLRALGGVARLEVDAARDVADLVPDDHVGDERDREDRDRRQGEHQPQSKPEPQR